MRLKQLYIPRLLMIRQPWLPNKFGSVLTCIVLASCSSVPSSASLSMPDVLSAGVDVIVVIPQKKIDVHCYGDAYLGNTIGGSFAQGAVFAGLMQGLTDWESNRRAESVDKGGMSTYDFDMTAMAAIQDSLSHASGLKIGRMLLSKDGSHEGRRKELLASKEPMALFIDVHYALQEYCRTASVTLSLDIFDTGPAAAVSSSAVDQKPKPVYSREFLSDISLEKPHDLLSRTLADWTANDAKLLKGAIDKGIERTAALVGRALRESPQAETERRTHDLVTAGPYWGFPVETEDDGAVVERAADGAWMFVSSVQAEP